MPQSVDAVLFDLDGTLADTAPDLAAALNALRIAENLPPVAPHLLRPYTSQGVRGMLSAGWGITPDDASYWGLYQRFLGHYQNHLCQATRLFAGMDRVLQRCASESLAWGVVTNKTQHFTLPLMALLGLDKTAACVVSGDSGLRPKPSGHPVLLASSLVGVPPARCIYVGDDERDIAAGQAAGMRTVAVRYGYLVPGKPIEGWGATHVIDQPEELLNLIFGTPGFPGP